MAYERPDPFRRDPGGPYDSLERERYAQARAKGASIKSASTEAGVSPNVGYTYERHDSMRLRIRELRAGAETYVGVSKGWLLNQLRINARKARKAGSYKASNDALGLIAKIVMRDPSLADETPRALSPDVTPKDLHQTLTSRFHARQRGTELVIATGGIETSRTTDSPDPPDPPDEDEDEDDEAAE